MNGEKVDKERKGKKCEIRVENLSKKLSRRGGRKKPAGKSREWKGKGDARDSRVTNQQTRNGRTKKPTLGEKLRDFDFHQQMRVRKRGMNY